MLISTATAQHDLPWVLAGPLLRRMEPQRLVLWLVGRQPLSLTLQLSHAAAPEPQRLPLTDDRCQVIQIGEHAFIHLIDLTLDAPLPCDVQIDYDLLIEPPGQPALGIADWAPKNGIRKVVTLVSDYGPGIDAERTFRDRFLFNGGQMLD